MQRGSDMIDTGFDFRSDAGGRDPDKFSPTLRQYHRALWSRALPGGAVFDLDVTTPGEYLHHRSALGEFFLSSDSVIPTFATYAQAKPVIDQLSEDEREDFLRIGYTIGGMMIFPSNRIDGKVTINAARGMNGSIADRMDLTLECIRRHFTGEPSPLGDVLTRYANFFALFEDFRGYVDYFLLQDLLADDGAAVEFFMPFRNFAPPAVPQDLDAYREYRRRSIKFIEARNHRVELLAL